MLVSARAATLFALRRRLVAVFVARGPVPIQQPHRESAIKQTVSFSRTLESFP